MPKNQAKLFIVMIVLFLTVGLSDPYTGAHASASSQKSEPYLTNQHTNIYQAKHMKSRSLKSLALHEVVNVTDLQSSWAAVKVGKTEGYVPIKHLKKRSTFESAWTSKKVNLKASRKQSSKTIIILQKNSKLFVLQEMGSWTKVLHNSSTGYVPSTALKSSEIEYSQNFQTVKQIFQQMNQFKHPEDSSQPMFVQGMHYEQTTFSYKSSKSKNPSIGLAIHEEKNGIYFSMYYKGSEIYALADPVIEQNYRAALKNISNSIYKKDSPEAKKFHSFCEEQLEILLVHASKHRYDENATELLDEGNVRIGKETFSYSNVNLSVDLTLDTRQ